MDHPISYVVVAVVSILATKLTDFWLASRRQSQAECKDEDERADKAYAVAMARLEKDKADLVAHIDVMDKQIKALQNECRDCERRHAALETKVEFLERELKALKEK